MMHKADSPSGQTSANGAANPAQSQDSSIATAARGRKTPDPAARARDRNGFSDKLTPEQEYNAHLELGRFQESQENFDLALGEYLKALEASESRSTLLGGARTSRNRPLPIVGWPQLDRLGRFEQAENEYSTALKLSPNDPKIWNDAGYSFYLQGRWSDAERAQDCRELDPNNTRIMTNLGLSLAASGKTEERSPSSPGPADTGSGTPTSLTSWPRWARRPRPRSTTSWPSNTSLSLNPPDRR